MRPDNAPSVMAEVRAAFAAYEAALIAGDTEALVAAFWDSDRTVRFGLAEALYGAEAIAAWRRSQRPVPPGRRLERTVIATFGTDFACVSTEFRYPRSSAVGRQSQAWVRRPEGWRIVQAHVSEVAGGEA